MLYREKIDKTRIPAHIAIIMDGNGRWAKEKGQARTFGHQAGAETVHVIAEESARLGVKFLTLYTFSTENWNRPVDEVAALMSLLMDSIEEETFMKNNISFRIIGDISRLPKEVLDRLNRCIENTSRNTGMCLTLALSYSSKWEITDAVKRIAEKVKNGELSADEITDKTIDEHLATNYMPDRTAYPYRWRDKTEQLSVVAVCLLGIVLLRHLLAGLQGRGTVQSHLRLSGQRTPIWKNK